MRRRDFITRSTAVVAGGIAGGSLASQSVNASSHRNAVIGESPFGPLSTSPDANGLLLPDGFSSRVVAVSGTPSTENSEPWHVFPDGGGTYDDNNGGWYYVSNSEVFPSTAPDAGGVSALHFDADGNLIDSYRILEGSNSNCAGGVTPWGTWLSCEEHPDGQGLVWECDPTGNQPAKAHEQMGKWRREAVAVDPVDEVLYMTEDHPNGRLYRYRPTAYPDLSQGDVEVCVVDESQHVTWENIPDPAGAKTPTYEQVPHSTVFPGNEGIWYHDGWIYFCTKHDHSVHGINLRTMTYELLWKGDPDSLGIDGAVLSGVDNITVHASTGDLYVAEDGGNMELVIISAERQVAPFLRLTDQDNSEITGPAFSPDGTRLYFSSQRGPTTTTLGSMLGIDSDSTNIGLTYEITGPFHRLASEVPLNDDLDTPDTPLERTTPHPTTTLATAMPISKSPPPESRSSLTTSIGLSGLAVVSALGALVAWRNRSTHSQQSEDL